MSKPALIEVPDDVKSAFDTLELATAADQMALRKALQWAYTFGFHDGRVFGLKQAQQVIGERK